MWNDRASRYVLPPCVSFARATSLCSQRRAACICSRVVYTRVVGPREVLGFARPSGAEVLTLVTCFPFDFLGSAPSRFIVRAERIENAQAAVYP